MRSGAFVFAAAVLVAVPLVGPVGRHGRHAPPKAPTPVKRAPALPTDPVQTPRGPLDRVTLEEH